MNILLADPHPEVQSALQLILEHMPGVRIIGSTGGLFQLIVQTLEECPDLILIDLEIAKPYHAHRRPDNQQGINIFTMLHKICPRAKVLVMSSRLETEREVLALGADGYISKTDSPEMVRATISNFLVQGQEARP